MFREEIEKVEWRSFLGGAQVKAEGALIQILMRGPSYLKFLLYFSMKNWLSMSGTLVD